MSFLLANDYTITPNQGSGSPFLSFPTVTATSYRAPAVSPGVGLLLDDLGFLLDGLGVLRVGLDFLLDALDVLVASSGQIVFLTALNCSGEYARFDFGS